MLGLILLDHLQNNLIQITFMIVIQLFVKVRMVHVYMNQWMLLED